MEPNPNLNANGGVIRRPNRKTISTSSPVTDMFRKLSHNVGAEIKPSALTNQERSRLINSTRHKKEVPPPQWFRLSEEELYPNGAKVPDHDLLKKHLREEGRLTLNCAIRLLTQAAELFREEPNLLALSNKLPLRVCGDIHGQFYDLLNLVEMAGDPRKDHFLFLGDYVDRGMFSTEVVLYLAALKVNFPDKIFMLRGNHECRLLTSHFNFMEECSHKYDSEVYYVFMELFDVLPIAAYVDNNIGRFLLVHGGISPELLDLAQINEIDRFVEPPGEGLLCDLLWSDPIDESTGDGLNEQEMLEWDSVDYVPNPDRGCSWVFGYSAIVEFLEQLNLVSVIRAHEVQKAGFKEHRFLKQREHAHLITVFSAPNYCDMYNNKAAFMLLREDRYEFKQTVHVGHPYYLPNFMDGLTYSLPFVMENLSRFAEDIITICLPKADEDVPEDEQEEVERLRGKILALSRLRHVMGGLGEDRRQSIKAPLPAVPDKGAAKVSLAKFEAALQMDFMKEYLKPGKEAGAGSTKAPIYRGRSKSLNFLDFAKHPAGAALAKAPEGGRSAAKPSGPPRPNFLPPVKSGAVGASPAPSSSSSGGGGGGGGGGSPRSGSPREDDSGTDSIGRSEGRRSRARAVKFGKPPDLSALAAAVEEGEAAAAADAPQPSKQEKRRSRDDWGLPILK